MADPKYADLPGIALDEPDVYETTDLPECEQTSDFFEEDNENIEHFQISTSDAFDKFRGKSLNSERVDFSERLSRRLRTGYDARSGDWELAQRGYPETLLQKYQRLQCETKELLEEVEKIKDGDQEESNYLVTGKQVQDSLSLLTNLQLEDKLGVKVVENINDPQGTQIKKLFSQLEQFKNAPSEQTESQTEGEDDKIVFQLKCKSEQTRFNQSNRLADLDQRLYQLETILGSSSNKLARLASMTSKDTIVETAQYLSATASLLDSAQLDHIEGRLTALSNKLDSIIEKKNSIAVDEEKDKMILELYELVKKNDSIYKLLPETIQRLKSLEAFHQKASDVSVNLTQMEALQASMSSSIERNKELLQGVQESFAANLEEINKTVTNLNTKIKALEAQKKK